MERAVLVPLVLTLLGAITIAVYRPSLHAPFVFDSVNNIAENPSIRMTRVDLPSLMKAAFPEKLNLRPLAFVTFALNYRVGGLETFGFRLVNLFILLATIPVAYWLALIISKAHLPASSAKVTALGATMIWSLHPILTNGVTFVVQRMTSLSTLLCMLALGVFCSGKLKGRRGIPVAAAVLWLLAVATKESALVAPLLAILFLWQVAPEGSRGRRVLTLTLVAAVAASQAALILFSSQIVRLGWAPEQGISVAQRALTEGRVVAVYLSLFLLPLPSRLNLDHGFALSTSLVSPPSTVLAFVLHALLIGAALGLRKRRPVVCYSVLSFYLLQLAEGTFLPVDLIFEHRLYFPSFFLALAVTDLFAWAWGTFAPRFWVPALAATVTLAGAGLALSTFQRNVLWSDPVALWQDSVAKSPINLRAYINLGKVLMQQGRAREALEIYRHALAVAPNYQKAHFGQGNALKELGLYGPAIASYQQAIRLDPNCLGCYNNLGYAYFALGLFNEAQRSYELVLEHDPQDNMARFNLGLTSLRLGQEEAAFSAYRELTSRQPDLANKLRAEFR